MLTFNAILANENIDPKKVRLVRHKDNRASGNLTPYNLWLAADGRLETYQQIQKRKVFEIGGLLASFVVTPKGETLFVGLYRLNDIGTAPKGTTQFFKPTEQVCTFMTLRVRRSFLTMRAT